MKKVTQNSIVWKEGTPKFEEIFQFEIFGKKQFPSDVCVVDMTKELEKKKNSEILPKVAQHPAMWSEVYSPSDELEIFDFYFSKALQENRKTFFIGITLEQEVKKLEQYYDSLGFFNTQINCYDVDYSKVLVGASVYIRNLMYRGSDYRSMKEKIFFCPPIRSAGEVKALFTGINRGSIAGIEIDRVDDAVKIFLTFCVFSEHILPITLQKVLACNFQDFGCRSEKDFLVLGQ